MKKLVGILVVLWCMSACTDEKTVPSNPVTKISFEYQLLNTSDNTPHTMQSSNVEERTSAWLAGGLGDDRIWLRKEIRFTSEGPDPNPLTVSLQVQGAEEDGSLLQLDNQARSYWTRDWNYRSSDTEIKNFWKNNTLNITLADAYLLSLARSEITNIQKVQVNGLEKTYLTIHFSGEAYGVYDANQESIGYRIENGIFEGVIE